MGTADFQVHLPVEGQGWYDLDRNRWLPENQIEREALLRAEVEELRAELARVKQQRLAG